MPRSRRTSDAKVELYDTDEEAYVDDEDTDYAADQSYAESTEESGLRKPEPYMLTYSAVAEYVGNGMIDLNADYQRDVVWASTKQGHLIDSIMKNFYVPPVIFSIRQAEDGADLRVAIDGKQRLTSVTRFMAGEIPLIDSTTGKRVWYSATNGRKRAVLTERQRQEFNNKQITCIEYRDLTIDQEIEIFRRVQLGVALTTAEKLYANNGPVAAFVREMQVKYESLMKSVDYRRKRDFTNILQAFIIVTQAPPTMPSASHMSRALEQAVPLSRSDRNLIDAILKILASLRDQYPIVFTYPTKLSPIEFMMSCYLIKNNPQDRLAVLRKKLEMLRQRTRAQFVDIRANSRCYVFMKECVEMISDETVTDDEATPPPAAKKRRT
ncbi:hypothetical protein HDU85_003535 [Gaertneriomyces sp. JEL0708]|nr:hypothetical protein HDU85_003535 [Gaertneriomyces sp. JEL0708]